MRRQFFAHKLILRARSAVLDKMFEHSTIEKNENRVIIDDINEQVFEQLLRFIYSAHFNDNVSFEELMIAADKVYN